MNATHSIAAHAYPTWARCQSSYKRLTSSDSFGYTPAKSTAKKAVAGCGSPKARGAKPHPARFAAFLFQATSFGGPNGRAQALPVTLRVPRSSTPVRAAAQCGSWSAVVHLAQLETTMAQIIPHPRAAATTVIQKRGPGRHPKMVLSFWKFRYVRDRAKAKDEIKRMEIDALRRAVDASKLATNILQHDLALQIQGASKGKS